MNGIDFTVNITWYKLYRASFQENGINFRLSGTGYKVNEGRDKLYGTDFKVHARNFKNPYSYFNQAGSKEQGMKN